MNENRTEMLSDDALETVTGGSTTLPELEVRRREILIVSSQKTEDAYLEREPQSSSSLSPRLTRF